MSESSEAPWVCIKRSRLYRKVAEAELVLIAMGIESRMQQELSGWSLHTPAPMESLAREQLKLYYWENELQRPVPIGAAKIDDGWAGVIGFLGVVWTVSILQFFGWIDAVELSKAAMVAGLVADGEWWRTVTALTLHGNFLHILSNSVFGLMFGIFCGRLFGSGLAWFLIVLCGAMGNWLNALVRPEDFVSIGASTATFAAAGLGSAFNWRRFRVRGGGLRENLTPIAGVVALFFVAGIGSERTDVVAHVTGLLCGLGAGAVVAGFDLRQLGQSGQWLAGGATTLIILYAWSFAV